MNKKETFYFSIESRKGGVGKTTVALNLGAKLLQLGYKVLLLDCDITGTSISECSENSIYWKDIVHVVKKKSENKIVAVNILDYFKNYYLAGNVDKWIKKGDSVFDAEKLNVIGSELYDEEKLVIDPRELMDELHSYWVINMLQEINKDFSSNSSDKKLAIIIDNSPGYAGMGRAIHEWLSDIGPEFARFLLVSSLDEQDIKSTAYSLKEIQRLVEGKIRVKKYYERLIGDKNKISLSEDEEEFLKSDGCFDRFFYKLAGGFEYITNINKTYKISDYATIVFNKVSEEYKKPEYYYDFNSVLTENYREMIEGLLGGKEMSSYHQFLIPFDYNIQTQYFSHRLKNQKLGTAKYWTERFKRLKESVDRKRKNRNVVQASFSMDNLIRTLKISMSQKGQDRMVDGIKAEWLMHSCLGVFKEQITDIAYYNKPDTRLDLSGLDKNAVMAFNKLSLEQFIKRKGLSDYEPLLDSFFDYLYKLAGAKKSVRDIRLLVTVSVFCNVLRSIHDNDFKKGSYESFLLEQKGKSMAGFVLKKYVGEFVPVTADKSLPTDVFLGVVGKCFEKFYQSACYAILRMIYRFDNYILLSDVLEKLILSGQYSEIPDGVSGILDDMIVKMLKPRDVMVFDRIINDKIRMREFERVVHYILINQWKL